MATTQLLSIGYPQVLTQNQIYALPSPSGRLVRITCDDATSVFNVSNDPNFGTFLTPTLSGSGLDSAWAFIRVTNQNTTVNLKKYI